MSKLTNDQIIKREMKAFSKFVLGFEDVSTSRHERYINPKNGQYVSKRSRDFLINENLEKRSKKISKIFNTN